LHGSGEGEECKCVLDAGPSPKSTHHHPSSMHASIFYLIPLSSQAYGCMVRVRARDVCVLDTSPKTTHHRSINIQFLSPNHLHHDDDDDDDVICVMKGPSNKSVGCIRGWGEGTRERERVGVNMREREFLIVAMHTGGGPTHEGPTHT
jgi:hypothetical protein